MKDRQRDRNSKSLYAKYKDKNLSGRKELALKS